MLAAMSSLSSVRAYLPRFGGEAHVHGGESMEVPEGWAEIEGALQRQFHFKDFSAAWVPALVLLHPRRAAWYATWKGTARAHCSGWSGPARPPRCPPFRRPAAQGLTKTCCSWSAPTSCGS